MFEIKKTFKMSDLSLSLKTGEGVHAFALAFVLFALTLRAALPLGLAVTVNEDGIPLVICQQVASVANLMVDENEGQKPAQAAYKCPYCMVLSADGAPLTALAAAPTMPERIAFLTIKPLKQDQIVPTVPTLSDNLGRDPPAYA
jgi:hypothetical protein